MDSEERQWLIEVKNDVKWIKDGFKNHLRHHTLYTIAAFTMVGAVILAYFFK